MIPNLAIDAWRENAPWIESNQVEQDLVLTKAIIQIYSDSLLRDGFAFRGGTAMQKLFLDSPTRYSEDIDLVQIRKEPIGPAVDAIRRHLDPWLGAPKRDRKTDRFTLLYRFQSETAPVKPMRLKIEVNNGEHFTVLPLQRKKIQAQNPWFSGEAEALTYEVEELLGTKMRALFQRKKGRDLFDLAMALARFSSLEPEKVIQCFTKYMAHEGAHVTRAQFEANLTRKIADPSFTRDIVPLLPINPEKYEVMSAYERVTSTFISRLPGEPWKGEAETDKRKK